MESEIETRFHATPVPAEDVATGDGVVCVGVAAAPQPPSIATNASRIRRRRVGRLDPRLVLRDAFHTTRSLVEDRRSRRGLRQCPQREYVAAHRRQRGFVPKTFGWPSSGSQVSPSTDVHVLPKWVWMSHPASPATTVRKPRPQSATANPVGADGSRGRRRHARASSETQAVASLYEAAPCVPPSEGATPTATWRPSREATPRTIAPGPKVETPARRQCIPSVDVHGIGSQSTAGEGWCRSRRCWSRPLAHRTCR